MITENSKTKEVVFINPPFLKGFSRESRSPAVTKSSTLYYPAWLAYACGFLEKHNIESILYDFVANKTAHGDACLQVRNNNPKLIVIGTSTPSIENDASFAYNLKLLLPDSHICLVGTHVSSTPNETLEKYSHVDSIARKEYDQTILELFKRIKSSESIGGLEGLSWRDRESNKIINEKERQYLHNLDELPFASQVYSKHLNIKDYFYGHVSYPMVSIFTSRGCNARCSYCVYPQTMFGNFRHRSPKSIVDELDWITKNLKEVKEVLIDDDTFSMYPKHAREVAQLIIERKVKIKWTCETRANLDYETLKLMHKAGCRLVVVGFESTDQKVLNNVRKGINQSNVDKFVDDCKKANVKIHACFMAGNPGDSFETLNNTLDWALLKNFDTAQFFPLQLYPGTKAYEDALSSERLLPKNYSDWITKEGLHKSTLKCNDVGLTDKEMMAFCDYARRKFYLRPKYIAKQFFTTFYKPSEFKKNIKGFLSLKKYLFRKSTYLN